MATKNSTESGPASFAQSMRFNGVYCVLRAARYVPAGGRKKGGYIFLIAPDSNETKFFHFLCSQVRECIVESGRLEFDLYCEARETAFCMSLIPVGTNFLLVAITRSMPVSALFPAKLDGKVRFNR